MAGGRAAAVRDRGGGRIPAGRASRTPLTTGVAAIVVAAVVGAAAAAEAGEALALVSGLAGAATVSLAAGLWRRFAIAVPWALLALGAAAAVSFAEDADPGRAPLTAAGLLAVGELSYWSLDVRRSDPAVGGLVARRAALLAGLVAGVIVLGTILVSVGRLEPGGGLLLETAGVAAAVALGASVLVLSRRAV